MRPVVKFKILVLISAVSKDSILTPLFFDIFLNDLILFVENAGTKKQTLREYF